jgi:hypothetical protein
MNNVSFPRITANIPGLSHHTQEEENVLSSLFPELSLRERLIGFACCYALGFLISLSSFGAFNELMDGEPLRFAVLYSFGNMTSLCASLFLVGFKQQIKNMTNKKRKVTAIVYLTCLFVTPLTAYLVPEMQALIVTLVFVQWASLSWYSLSYVPFGQRMARNLANHLLS